MDDRWFITETGAVKILVGSVVIAAAPQAAGALAKFFATPKGKVIAAGISAGEIAVCATGGEAEACIGLPGSAKVVGKIDNIYVPQVIDPKLENLIDNVYKGIHNSNKVGDGTLMDAVIYEIKTGNKVHGRGHIIKAQETIRGLQNWLNKHGKDALEPDRQEVLLLISQLQDALKGIK